jgi:hypothetical protein
MEAEILAAVGGALREITYDRMKTAVIGEDGDVATQPCQCALPLRCDLVPCSSAGTRA